MDCWKHYPWISAPKCIIKDGICLNDWFSVSVTITWKGNTVISDKLPFSRIFTVGRLHKTVDNGDCLDLIDAEAMQYIVGEKVACA